MPIYEYLCSSCGAFDERRQMDAAGESADCPRCAQAAPRSYSLAVGSAGRVQRASGQGDPLERAHTGEPSIEKRATRGPGAGGAAHGHASSQRPWMIGH